MSKRKGNIRHGLRGHQLYCTWSNMMYRCYNPKSGKWSRYGGRGIKVCKRWHSLVCFIEDMGVRPKGRTLDRKDNNKNYSKSNCRWATSEQQCNNMEKNVWLKYGGKTKTLAQWARHLGMNRNTLKKRWRLGWSSGKILGTPVDYMMSEISRRRGTKSRTTSRLLG